MSVMTRQYLMIGVTVDRVRFYDAHGEESDVYAEVIEPYRDNRYREPVHERHGLTLLDGEDNITVGRVLKRSAEHYPLFDEVITLDPPTEDAVREVRAALRQHFPVLMRELEDPTPKLMLVLNVG